MKNRILTVTDDLFSGERLPSEDHQFSRYKAAIERQPDCGRIFKTFDMDAENAPDCLGLKRDHAGFGLFSTRVALSRSDILKTQFRALCRAAYHAKNGDIYLAVPMITDRSESCRIKDLLEKVLKELKFERVLFGRPKIGAMIETPAAALSSDGLAEDMDMLIINTDRLARYTLAADTNDPVLKSIFRPDHPAVLKLIITTAENAKKAGIPLAVSGCLAADKKLYDLFEKIGAAELFISPERITDDILCLV